MDFSKQIQKAEEAARRRNYDFAVQLYRQLLDIDPDQGEARAGLRRALLKRHEARKGGKLFRALAGAGPLAMAKGLAKAGRHEAAAKALESFLETDPTSEEANLLLGAELEAAGHLRSARAVLDFLTEIAPRSVEGLKRAGAVARRLGDPARALACFERALEVDPRDQEAIKARKDLSAEEALARASQPGLQHSREQIRDKDEAARLERSQRLVRSDEDLREELAELEARYADSPSDPDLLERMGAVHERLGDPEAALDVMERALSYRKDSFELLVRVAELKAKVLKKALRRADSAGDRSEADRLEAELRAHELEDLRRRVGLRPGDPALRLALGRKLLRVQEHDAAAAEFQKAVGDARAAREAHVGLAQCFQAKGFLDLARQEYERALEDAAGVDERAKEILYNLGAIAEAEGRPDEARERYARIFAVDIGYRDVAGKMEGFRRT